MKRLRIAILAIVAILCWAKAVPARAASTPALVIEPACLPLDATLNSPVVLRLEVTSTKGLLGPLDLRAEGIRIQREIHPSPDGGAVFLIEPDTSRVGNVSGHVCVVDSAGTVLCSVPLVGKVRPLVSIYPERVFLGGLEYGTASGRTLEKRFRLTAAVRWKILGIDTTDILGASSEIVADTDGDKELVVRFAEDALKEGQPFGAFIKRDIRISTDVSAQPEVTIPVAAMLSINKTDRDFHTYIFRGNERWQGHWDTPNIAAAVVAPLVLLLLGWGAVVIQVLAKQSAAEYLLPLKTRAFRCTCQLLAAALLVLSGAGMVLLVKTYSRGGWVAFGAGLALMLIITKGQRRILLSGMAFFLAVMLLLPAGLERAVSASSVNEDQSIGHRLLVWRGALEMIADHPWHGVGAGRFGEVFTLYYQEPWHKDYYTTAISDYLTFAAERGLIGVVGMVGIAACLVVGAVGYTRRYEDFWIVPMISALLALGTSSVFSSVEFVGEVRWLSGAMVILLAVYCGLRFVLERKRARTTTGTLSGKIWLPSAGAGIVAGGLLVGAVIAAGWLRPASCLMPSDTLGKIPPVTRIDYLPARRAIPKATLLFLPASPEPLSTLGKQVLRPLAESGWHTVAMDLCMYDQEAARQVAAALRGSSGPTLILAQGTRARVAVMAMQLLDSPHRPELIFVDPVLHSALTECDRSGTRGISTGAVVITGERWLAFRRDGRSGLDTIIQICDAATRRALACGPNGALAEMSQHPRSAVVPGDAIGL